MSKVTKTVAITCDYPDCFNITYDLAQERLEGVYTPAPGWTSWYFRQSIGGSKLVDYCPLHEPSPDIGMTPARYTEESNTYP